MAASPLIQFRATGALSTEVSKRVETGRPVSEVARRDLERYYVLLRHSLPTFSRAEAFTLASALNGTITTPETAHLLWAQVEDFLRDTGALTLLMPLVERLRALTPFEALAVADAVEQAWNSETYSIGNMEERLRAVGLIKREEDK